MTRLSLLLSGASLVVILGITMSMPLVVTAATMCACGTVLYGLLNFFSVVKE